MADLRKVVVEASASRNIIISIGIRTDAQIEVTSQKIRWTCQFLSKRATFPTSFHAQNHLKYNISDCKWLLLIFFCSSLCEVILVEFDVLAKKHSSKFGVKTRKIEFVQDILRGTRNPLLL